MIFHVLFDIIELIISPNRKGLQSTPNRVLQERKHTDSTQNILSDDTDKNYHTVVRKLELDVLLMAYLMQQDDGMITPDEAKIIRHHITPHTVILEDVDLQRLDKMTRKQLSIEDIIYHIEQKQYTEGEVQDAMNLLLQVNQTTKRHTRYITKLRSELHNRYFY